MSNTRTWLITLSALSALTLTACELEEEDVPPSDEELGDDGGDDGGDSTGDGGDEGGGDDGGDEGGGDDGGDEGGGDDGGDDGGEEPETFSPTPGAWYKLHTEFQGEDKCLEGNQSESPVHDGAAFLDDCQEVSGQYWTFEATGDYFLAKTMFLEDEACLEGNQADSEIKDGAAFMNDCAAPASGQAWQFIVNGDYLLMQTQFLGEDKCLEGNQAGSEIKNGAAFMDDCSGVSGQNWVLEEVEGPAEPEYFTLHNAFLGEDQCLEGNQADSETKDGAAFMNDCTSPATGQVWYAVPIDEEGVYVKLKTMFQGDYKCLEGNEAGSEVHGGNAFMDDCQDASGQIWYSEDSGDGVHFLLKTEFLTDSACLEGNQSDSTYQDGAAFMNTCSSPSTGQLWYPNYL